METLRFTGLHEDGAALVVTAADGSDYLVPIEDRLRSAVRQQRTRQAASAARMTPREVQAMIRAGMTPEEVSEQTGWDTARVQRYEAPIVAEREHIARLARAALIRTHQRTGQPPTLESRAIERLSARGVPLDRVGWDSTRPEGGQWTIVITFVAGQRDRNASWRFDPVTRSVDALDDEARWLSEDEQSLPREMAVTAVFGRGQDAPDDLASSMRERSRQRGGRSRRPRTAGAAATTAAAAAAALPLIETQVAAGDRRQPDAVPGRESFPDEALPLEDFPYDPDTMGLPPSAHGHVDGDDEAGEAREDLAEDASGHVAAHVEEDAAEAPDEGDEAEPAHPEPTLEDFFGPREDDEDDEAQDDGPQDNESQADEPQVDEPQHGEGLDVGSRDGAAGAGVEEDSPTVHSGDPAASPEDAQATGDSGTSRRRGRPSVPSWDDIMFGAKDRGR